MRSLLHWRPLSGKHRLAVAFKEGDEWAFAKIHSQFRKQILRFVSQKISDPEVAEDITQEIFIKVHRFRGIFDPQCALSPWIWTIARNSVTDWLRRQMAESQGLAPGVHDAESVDQVACHGPDPERLLTEKSMRQALSWQLGRLSALQRKVLQMRLIQQLSYQEISRTLGISISAAKCLMYRAKLVLAEELGERDRLLICE